MEITPKELMVLFSAVMAVMLTLARLVEYLIKKVFKNTDSQQQEEKNQEVVDKLDNIINLHRATNQEGQTIENPTQVIVNCIIRLAEHQRDLSETVKDFIENQENKNG